MAEPRQLVRVRMILTMCYLLLFHPSWSAPALPSTPAGTLCIPHERDALLNFKVGLTDPGNLLLSWQGVECCRWMGVTCSNRTGHVVTLQIEGQGPDGTIGGEIRSSLLTLRHLKQLDLSFNDFGGKPIPELIGALGRGRLTDLYLSNSNFGGRIPPHLGNLSNLVSLDLSNMANGSYSPDLGWVSHLTKLQLLSMSAVDLSAVVDWTHDINMLPYLIHLDLSICGLQNTMPPPSHSNLTSLETFYLTGNSFNTSLGAKNFVWDLPSLQVLILTGCGIDGPIPDAVGNLTSIQNMDLGYNSFTGTMPLTFKKLKKLQQLVLNSNFINMEVADTRVLVNVKDQQLEYTKGIAYMVNIDFSCNSLTGQIPQEIGMLIGLKNLNLSWNNLTGIIPQSIGELHALESFDLSHNELSGEIPTSLSALTSLSHLNLSYNDLTGTIPPGNQLRALEDPASIYIGNPGLCGPPLQRNCSRADIIPYAPQEHDEGMSDVVSLHLRMCIGFVVGLWVVFCGFLFKRKWRVGWFSFTDNMYDQAYVQAVVGWASLARKIRQG